MTRNVVDIYLQLVLFIDYNASNIINMAKISHLIGYFVNNIKTLLFC